MIRTTKGLIRVFKKKKSFLDRRLKKDFIDNGIATIPCQVEEYNDVISRYSVRGYETLNSEFEEYVKNTVDVIPSEYPVVLNITGCSFSSEQEQTIRETITEDFAYDLGLLEEELRRHVFIFSAMLLALILACAALRYVSIMPDITYELYFVVFWYAADTVVDYLFVGGRDMRNNRIRAGRLACVKVVFSESYDEEDYTKGEAGEIIRELEEEVDRETPDGVYRAER